MTKGRFALLTAALGLATMTGAGYFGYAHADSPSPKGSGSSGNAMGGQGRNGGTGSGGAAAGSASGGLGGAAGDGSGANGGSVAPAAVPQCTGQDIQVTETNSEGAAGTLSLVLDFTDTSGHACFLRGYPGAAMLGQDGSTLLNATRTLVGPAGGATGLSSPPRVVLRAGGTGTAIVEWSDVSNGTEGCASPVSLAVTPPNTKQTTTFNLSGPAEVCSGFEVHPLVPESATGG